VFFSSSFPPHSKLYAENTDKTFQSATFRINLVTNINRNTLHQYWNPLLGGEAEIETPFYAGEIRVGLHLYQFNGKTDDYPDYLVGFFYIGWGVEIPLISQLGWFNGIRLGSYQMGFDDTDINPTQRVESELAVGIDTGLNLKLSSRWQGHVGIGYIAVFTQKKIELLNLSVGISYTINSPDWLREFLK